MASSVTIEAGSVTVRLLRLSPLRCASFCSGAKKPGVRLPQAHGA